MPLDHIDRLAAWPRTRAERDRRPPRLVRAVFGVALLLVLAGCNSGAMNEARRSQEFDTAETPQLSAQQATRTARTFFAPTGTPAAEGPLTPSVETLVITLGVNPDGSPSGSYLTVPADAGTVYATALLGNVQAGQRVAATFTDAFGNVVGGVESDLTADADAQWLVVPLNLSAIGGPGEFAIYVFAGGHQLGSLAFTISGAGSGAQLLPDLPANPQAQTQPTAGPQSNQPTMTANDANQGGGEWQQNEESWDENGAQQNGANGQQPDQSGQQGESTWVQQPDGTWLEQPPSQ